jgi:hypothetical protein
MNERQVAKMKFVVLAAEMMEDAGRAHPSKIAKGGATTHPGRDQPFSSSVVADPCKDNL